MSSSRAGGTLRMVLRNETRGGSGEASGQKSRISQTGAVLSFYATYRVTTGDVRESATANGGITSKMQRT